MLQSLSDTSHSTLLLPSLESTPTIKIPTLVPCSEEVRHLRTAATLQAGLSVPLHLEAPRTPCGHWVGPVEAALLQYISHSWLSFSNNVNIF